MAQASQASAKSRPAVLITGASAGIGATYADRFARRGHDLVLVARDKAKMDDLAKRLITETGVAVDVLQADLTQAADLARVEKRLREDERIGILVNNAGIAAPGGFVDADATTLDRLISLNVTAVTRLSSAVVPRFLKQGEGAIINIASVLGLAPEISFGIYGASKAYVLMLSQSLQVEVGERGVYVQAVLPAATRTEIWSKSGRDPNAIEGMMDVGEMVDAALTGYDQREAVTIPSLPDAHQWEAFNTARQAMLPNFRNEHAAQRYRAVPSAA